MRDLSGLLRSVGDSSESEIITFHSLLLNSFGVIPKECLRVISALAVINVRWAAPESNSCVSMVLFLFPVLNAPLADLRYLYTPDLR